MTKKIIAVLLALAIAAPNAMATVENKGMFAGGWQYKRQKKAGLAALPGGLSFFNDYRKRGTASDINTLNAKYSDGSQSPTFTASRDSTHPATYFDANGVLQVTTTSNAPRFTQGYYDDTGWHSAPGLLLEGASTNGVTNSYMSIDTNSDGTVDGVGFQTTLSVLPTYSQVSASELMTDGYAQRIAFTGESGKYWLSRSSTLSITAGAYVTMSTFIMGSVGAGSLFLQVNSRDGNNISLADYSSDTISLSSTGWRRFSFTTNAINAITRSITAFADAGGGAVTITWSGSSLQPSQLITISGTTHYNGTYTLTVVDSSHGRITAAWAGNDATGTITVTPVSVEGRLRVDNTVSGAYDFRYTGVQLETGLYPSSFIPTTTAALTRNAESLSYASAGNFPAPSGGNCLSFDGQNASGDDYVSVPNSATGNQVKDSTAYSWDWWGIIRSDGESDGGRIFDKSSGVIIWTSGQSGSNVAINYRIARATANAQSTTTVAIPVNVFIHLSGSFDGTNAPKIYYNGSECSYSGSPTGGTGNLTDDSGNAGYIGNAGDGTKTFDGFIQSVRIYRDKALSSGEVMTAYNAGRYASLPVTGCTAQYLFNEGSGSTLTDGVEGNNGTISGATWSKDTHAGTILLKYRPVMLPNEQPSSYRHLFECNLTGAANNNDFYLCYDTNANNGWDFFTRSNNNALSSNVNSASTWSRYSSKMLTGSFSISANEAGKKVTAYVDSTAGITNANFAVPAGVLPSGFLIQASSGNVGAMILEAIGIWNRALSASEVAAAYNYFNTEMSQ